MTARPRTTTCPSCGAALRPDAPWCTLCYTDLRPKPAPEPVASPPTSAPATAAYGVPASDPLTQPLVDFLPVASTAPVPAPRPRTADGPASWPCTACEAVNPMTESACLVCGKSFLAALKSTEQPLLVLPLVGDVGAMSRGHRLGLAAGAVLLLLIPLALITLLMTGKAPQAPLDQTPSPSPTVLHTEPAGTPAVQ